MGTRDEHAEAVDTYLALLEEHKPLCFIPIRTAPDRVEEMRERRRDIENELLRGHAFIAALARRYEPGLRDLIELRMATGPDTWPYRYVYPACQLLKGAIDDAERIREVQPVNNRKLSTQEDRARYAKALYEHGAVGDNVVQSKEIGYGLGLDEEVLADVESWLSAAGLIKFVTFGPTVTLTHAGRLWVEGGADLERPPAGSHTTINNVTVGPGATVGSIQAAGAASTQHAEVQIDVASSLSSWVGDARQAVIELGDQLSEAQRAALDMRLDDVEEAVAEDVEDRSRLRRAIEKVLGVFGEVAVATAGSAVAPGVIEAGSHLLKLL